MTDLTDITPELAQNCRAWPFEEAKKVLKKIGNKLPDKGYVLFETGYGPSGLPHIGTFQEVARTTMVMHAFHALAPDMPTKMVCFSDDMDGFRKVPGNVPNQEMLAKHLGEPLTIVPDPFGEFDSFADYNNACLNKFLDSFGFEYDFKSSTKIYKAGEFDDALLMMLEKHEEIQKAVIPILGKERAATYSPFLPISPKSGKVLQVPILEVNVEAGTVTFDDEDGTRTEVPVTGGHCKAQWRPDWGMRWFVLDVDYEMAGEDLKSSADVAGRVAEILGGTKPAGFHYKLFLDEDNQKISKSKGNGITIDQWLTYAPNESLSYYVFQRPKSGKKLHFDVIPKAVDDYITSLQKMPEQEPEKKIENAVWYIHGGKIPDGQQTPLSFALLLNLASASNAHDEDIMWGFINLYAPEATKENSPFLARLVGYALRYYTDFVLPNKSYRTADLREETALRNLKVRLESMIGNKPDSETIQTEIFSAGKENGYDKSELRQWFQAIYEVLLGQSQGPRFGSFVELYGIQESIALIDDALDGKFMKAA
jgi:lysyl-tRNA synthetase class 1